MGQMTTILLGIAAILFPVLAGRFAWKNFDRYFGKNDQEYMDTLQFFLKKTGFTILVAFVFLWIGLSIVFQTQVN